MILFASNAGVLLPCIPNVSFSFVVVALPVAYPHDQLMAAVINDYGEDDDDANDDVNLAVSLLVEPFQQLAETILLASIAVVEVDDDDHVDSDESGLHSLKKNQSINQFKNNILLTVKRPELLSPSSSLPISS